jgi:hypothetical protein
MSKIRTRIMTFLLLGSLLLTGCQKNAKGESIGGAYVEYPTDETLSGIETTIPEETTEIMPPFTTETIPEDITPEVTIPKETEKEELEETTPNEPIVEQPTEPLQKEEESPTEKTHDNIEIIATTNVNLRSSNSSDSIKIDQLITWTK